MTLGTLRTAVSSKLGLDNTASSAEQSLMDSWINQGVREVLLRTQCTVEHGTMDTIADTWRYQLDTDILLIRHLWREDSAGDVLPTIQMEESEIIDLHRSSSSSDAAYLHYAVAGSNLLLVWPTPSSVYTINLLYVPRPAEMSSDSHDPSTLTYGRVPAEYHKAIEYYALWQGAEYDENAGTQHGERYRSLFEKYLADLRTSVKRKASADLPRVRTRRGLWRSRGLTPRDNDRY